MATIQNVKSKIQGLIDKSNEATGGSDTDLTTAIDNLIANQGGGDIPIVEKDINFYDYDGTLLYSYTLEEIQNVTQLPPLPSHDGLICQEWNWTLEDIKAEEKETDVGATYITDDGKTRLYGSFVKGITGTIKFVQDVANGVTVDWGDGSTSKSETVGSVSLEHTFTANSEMITLEVADGCTWYIGGSYTYIYSKDTITKIEFGKGITQIGQHSLYFNGLQTITIPNSVTTIGKCAFYYCYTIKAIIFPKNCTSYTETLGDYLVALGKISLPNGVVTIPSNFLIGNNSLNNLNRLTLPNSITAIDSYGIYSVRGLKKLSLSKSLTTLSANTLGYLKELVEIDLPSTLTTIGEYAFNNNDNLKSITIPISVTSIGKRLFDNCYTLEEITLQENVISVTEGMFAYCRALKKVTFLGDVKAVNSYAFNGCLSLREIDFTKCTSVPSLANTNALTNVPSGCQIKVPSSLLSSWKSASNWSTYKTMIVAG